MPFMNVFAHANIIRRKRRGIKPETDEILTLTRKRVHSSKLASLLILPIHQVPKARSDCLQ
jgi:hypothetical protein